MVAYNFQQQFTAPITRRSKRQTIRRVGKRRHARPGDAIQLYTGMRTKQRRKIIDDVECVSCEPIVIRVEKDRITVFVSGTAVGDMEAFARSDGFGDRNDFHQFWLKSHGVGEHDYVLIRWKDA